jgi:hypothetical protein
MHAAKTAHCHSESELSQTRELTAILCVVSPLRAPCIGALCTLVAAISPLRTQCAISPLTNSV